MQRSLLPFGLAGLAAGLFALPAAAQDLFLGSGTTLVSRNDALDGSGSIIGACGGVVRSMEDLAGQVFIGTASGNVYNWKASTNQLIYAYTALNDATALLAEGGELLIGGSDGSLLRYDTFTGVKLAELQVGLPVRALALHGGQVVVGSDGGFILVGDPHTGGFQFVTGCGNGITALVSDGNHVLASDVAGNVWRIDVVNHSLLGSFAMPAPATCLSLFSGDLLAGSASGNVRRFDRHTGALKDSFHAGFQVDALTLVAQPEPGLAYCFGVGCPCGNDDPENACVNSTGFGPGLVAIGTPGVSADDLVMTAHDLPKNGIARFYMGPTQQSIPFGAGLLCAGGGAYPTFRFPAAGTGSHGLLRLGPGVVEYAEQNFGMPGLISAGTTWHFQAWYRDPSGPCGQTVNTSNAYTVNFLP